MREIPIKGATYRVGDLDAMGQFHVGRRVLPVLATMGISVASLRKGLTIDAADMAISLGPISEVVSRMDDAHVEYVIGSCLSVVQRKEGKEWAPVATNGVQILYADIKMDVMLRLVWAVLQENLANFLSEPPETEQSGSS